MSRRSALRTARALLAADLAKGESASTRRFRFVQWDVFTKTQLTGNQLVVFPDARGLTDAEMQAITWEVNQQETTFVLPREPEIEKKEGIRVRIFLPAKEVPFAGHPTLGTAFALQELRRRKKFRLLRSCASLSMSARSLSSFSSAMALCMAR